MSAEGETLFTSASLPSLTDVSSPAQSVSRRTSRRESATIVSPSPHLRVADDDDDDDDEDTETGEKRGTLALDPRRFTPNLHANLVAEILNLRREVENKNQLVYGLEESLSVAKDENRHLTDKASYNSKENRSLRRQIQLLESGTMTALEQLAEERDSANGQLSETKSRLDASQKKLKSREEEVERITKVWEADKDRWDRERRNLNTKVHIVEGRLKTVLAEVAAASQMHSARDSSDTTQPSGSESFASSDKRESSLSHTRSSSISSDGKEPAVVISQIQTEGTTLADELNSDQEFDDEYEPSINDVRARPVSVQSYLPSVVSKLEEQGATSLYCDASTQYESEVISTSCQTESPLLQDSSTQHEEEEFADAVEEPIVMVASCTQTEELPESAPEPAMIATQPSVPVITIHPPATRTSGEAVLPPRTRSTGCQVVTQKFTKSVSVQTEPIRVDQRLMKIAPHLLPSAIDSRPHSPVLDSPKYRADRSRSGTETKLKISIPEEPLRQPKRVSRPRPRPERVERADRAERIERAERSVRSERLESVEPRSTEKEKQSFRPRSVLPEDGYISDDSFLSKEPIRKTLSKVENSWALVPHTEDPIGDQLESNNKQKIEEIEEKEAERSMSISEGKKPRRNNGLRINKAGKVIAPIKTSQKSIRRSALISSGTAAHQLQRRRSPSMPETLSPLDSRIDPPFPVPDRSSSRKFPWADSDSPSPSPQTVTFFGADQKRRQYSRPPSKKPALRKVRSANANPYKSRTRSRSPPPTSNSSFGDLVEQHSPPPLPTNNITSPFSPSGPQEKPLPQEPERSIGTSGTVSSSPDQVSVVDAIAQTMIGEWMWKYVGRRRSFAKPGHNNADNDTSGARHQRWVWLAPYERAVMWSSKQPTTGTALMGKNGRKLTIQSVLDVKDDNSSPKGSDLSSCFDRSILILTPQRALKFTAPNRERHIVWLTALSFLSHSSVVQAEPTEPTEPPPPPPLPLSTEPQEEKKPEEPKKQRSRSSLRRPIRDSIRIAKNKPRPSSARSPTSITSPNSFTSPTFDEAPQIPDFIPQVSEIDAADYPHVPRSVSPSRKRRSSKSPGFSPAGKGSRRGSLGRSSNLPRTESESALGWMTDGGGNSRRRSRAPPADWVNEPMPQPPENFFEAVGTVRMEAFIKNKPLLNDSAPLSAPLQPQGTKSLGRHSANPWGRNNTKAGFDFFGDS